MQRHSYLKKTATVDSRVAQPWVFGISFLEMSGVSMWLQGKQLSVAVANDKI